MSWRDADRELVQHLDEWNFDRADLALRAEHPEELRVLVVALASTFGDCGPMVAGHLGVIIAAAVRQCFVELRMAGG